MTAITPLSLDMYLPSLPEMSADLGISTSLAQMTLTMTMLGMSFGQIFLGPLSDRFGRRVPLLLGMAVFTAASYGAYLVGSIEVFLLCRFLQGFSGASGIVIARAIARDVAHGAELTRLFAILTLISSVAPIAAPIVGGQILRFLSWRGVFMMLTLVGLLLVTATAVYRETLPPQQRIQEIGRSFASFPSLLRDRYFLGHCLLQLFFFSAFFSYISGSSFVFQNYYHLSAQGYSLLFGIIGCGLFLSGMIPAKLAGRVPDAQLLAASIRLPLLSTVLLLAGFLLDAPVWYAFLMLFLTITPLSVMCTESYALALSDQGEKAGAASALLGFCQTILGGAMMPLVGINGDADLMPMTILMLVGYLLSELVCRTLLRKENAS